MELNEQSIAGIWTEVLGQVGLMLAGELGKANLPAISAPNQLVISFPRSYNRQYQSCADPLRLQRIQDAVNRVTGQSWTIRCELTDDVAVQAIIPTEPRPIVVGQAATEPLIEKVQASLAARLLKVDDGFGEALAKGPATDEPLPAWPSDEEE